MELMTKNMTNYKLFSSSISLKIFENCDNFWEKIMIEDTFGNIFSGYDYKNNAINYAIKLQKIWVKKWDSVVIFIRDTTKFSYICLSVLLAWAKIILLEKEYSKETFEEKLSFLKPDFVIIDDFLYNLLHFPIVKNFSKIDKFSPLLKFPKNIIINSKKEKLSNEEKIIFEKIDENTESIVVFTGWTTWQPKWVVHTIFSLKIMLERISEIIGSSSKIFFADLPHFVLIGILSGSKIIVWKNDISDKKFLKILKKYNIDTTFSPPYRFLNILHSKEKIPKNLKHILLGSAPIYASFLEKFFQKIENDAKVTCIYGMTEMLPIACIDAREKLDFKGKWDILWKIFSGINIEISTDNELIISWDWLFKKYIWNEEIKKHKTWDLVDFDGENIIMKWRKKDMIIRKDYNIYPALYESKIAKISGIIDVAMVWIWDEKSQDEKIILFLEWEKISLKKLRPELEKILDNFAMPDEIIFTKIPRKWRQNKIDKNSLRNNYNLWK